MKKKNIGSSFDDWLREENLYEEVTAVAIKRALARQIRTGRRTTASHPCRPKAKCLPIVGSTST